MIVSARSMFVLMHGEVSADNSSEFMCPTKALLQYESKTGKYLIMHEKYKVKSHLITYYVKEWKKGETTCHIFLNQDNPSISWGNHLPINLMLYKT